MPKILRNLSITILIVLLFLPILAPIAASWNTTATVVGSGSNEDYVPQIIADGAGGVIIAWLELTSSDVYTIRVQHLNSDGVRQWDSSGFALATLVPHDKSSDNPKICTDGAGGAFVVWRHDIPSQHRIYVRRVTSTGTFSFDAVRVSFDNSQEMNFDICADGAGGVIIVWQDNRETNYNIYAQRIDASGTKLWGFNGTVVCNETEFQVVPRVSYNGSGGVYVVWADRRDNPDWDLYAQHLDLNGDRQWTLSGVAICDDAAYQSLNDICSDGAGGAIIVWSDARNAGDYDIYAQRIAPNGTQFWGVDGKRITSASGDQTGSKLCYDGANGVILIWQDKRDDSLGDIYGQRLNSTGHDQWAANGIPIANEVNEQQDFEICSDNASGAFMVWEDLRSSSHFEIYQQRINATGFPYSTGNGTLVVLQTDEFNPVLTCISSGEVVIAGEGDNGDNYDIYAQIYPIRITGDDSGIPGFLLLYLLLAIPMVLAIYRKRINS
ncbi:MAG: hypothetical protein ACTSQ8_25510 [Candidatus Helarchaeota archaeon]